MYYSPVTRFLSQLLYSVPGGKFPVSQQQKTQEFSLCFPGSHLPSVFILLILQIVSLALLALPRSQVLIAVFSPVIMLLVLQWKFFRLLLWHRCAGMFFRQTHLKASHDYKFLLYGRVSCFFSEEDVCLLFKREGASQIWEQMNKFCGSVSWTDTGNICVWFNAPFVSEI